MNARCKASLIAALISWAVSYPAAAQRSVFDLGQNVGIGTTAPNAALEIRADWFNPPAYATGEQKKAGAVNLRLDGTAPTVLWHHVYVGPTNMYALAQLGDGGLDGSLNFYLRRLTRPIDTPDEVSLESVDSGWQRVLSLSDDLSVQIDHDLAYQGQQTKLDVGPQFRATVHCADFTIGHPSRRGNSTGRALVDWNDPQSGYRALVINWGDDWPITRIGGKATEVNTLTILGGADVAEPFEWSAGQEPPPKGAVVVIDEEHPGSLRQSDQPYDRRVAGVISGANGISPGLALRGIGAGRHAPDLALSGRVYVLADAAEGAIRPGDLLTTSSTPGHAMKVTDQARSQGAVLGKAMSSLKEGKGMVLVLVTLQ